jgi:hypothetical protein
MKRIMWMLLVGLALVTGIGAVGQRTLPQDDPAPKSLPSPTPVPTPAPVCPAVPINNLFCVQ